MKKLTVLFFICLSTFISTNATAQVFPSENGKSLKGVDAFDLRVVLQNWMRMGNNSEEGYQYITQLEAKKMLNENGIEVNQNAPNYLICDLRVIGNESHLQASFSIHTSYYKHSPSDLHTLLWESNSFGYTGIFNFDFEDVAEICVGNFIAEWNKYN